MSDELFHECGVAALYWLDQPVGPEGPASQQVTGGDVAPLMPGMLLDLQNRGQLAAGMSTYNPDRPQLIETYKEIGTVAEAFRMSHPAKHRAIVSSLRGRSAIGHTRYATCGADMASHAQPFERHHGRRWKWFSFAFNGQLANYTAMRDRLLAREAYHFSMNTDTEIIMHQLSFHLRGDRRPNLVSVMRGLGSQFDGCYNLVFTNAMGDMFVARDPYGFRPLCFAAEGRLFAAASESMALSNLGFTDIRSLPPGTMAVVRNGKLSFHRFAKSKRVAHCFFEWVYFANVGSSIDDTSVYVSRSNAGQLLADQEDQPIGPDCIVVPVPDTAKAAADSFAFHLGIPSVEGLIRNRYVGRTFILGRDSRAISAKRKYTPLPAVLEGKRVFLVEDSVVRSTTLAALVSQMRTRGKAREVHVRVACPPIIAPCFYGIDMSTVGELFAPKYVGKGYRGVLNDATSARMAKALGVDSLRYLSVPDMAKSLQIELPKLCTACVTGKYPTPWGNRLIRRAKANYREGKDGRTYE